MLSVKSNIIANYVSQIYTILITIIVTPFYLKYLGTEAYGLVTFFALLQALMNFLDQGLSQTLARQTAHARSHQDGFVFLKRLLKSFELIFLILAFVIFLVFFIASEWISYNWIKADSIDPLVIVFCITLMGGMISVRWFASLYRSGIVGQEDQVWLSFANIIIISFKFIGALVVLAFFSQDIQHFFIYQLIIGLLEIFVFMLRFYSKLPVTENGINLVYFDWQAIKSIAPFTMGIAYTSGLWVLITQTDKLILSGILTLSEFGYFGLVALLAGGILSSSGPISQAIMPRMTLLIGKGMHNEMESLYRQASQIITVISLSIALIMGLYAYDLIFAWTGNSEAANWGSNILLWFSLGNGILAVNALQFYLQSSYGKLRLHVIGTSISAIIQVPIIFYAAVNYGAEGAGIAWFGFRLVWFLGWTPIVHSNFLPGSHISWLLKDILPIVIFTVMLALFLKNIFIIDLANNRALIFLQIAIIGFLLLFGSSMSSRSFRKRAYLIIKMIK